MPHSKATDLQNYSISHPLFHRNVSIRPKHQHVRDSILPTLPSSSTYLTDIRKNLATKITGLQNLILPLRVAVNMRKELSTTSEEQTFSWLVFPQGCEKVKASGWRKSWIMVIDRVKFLYLY